MNRFTVRSVAAALALVVTVAELIGIAVIADVAPFPAIEVVVLPRVVVSPPDPREAPGDSQQVTSLTARLPRT